MDLDIASTRQNPFSGFLTKQDSNQSPQLQRLARKMIFFLVASLDMIFSINVTKVYGQNDRKKFSNTDDPLTIFHVQTMD